MSDPIHAFFDRDVQTDGPRVIFTFANHGEAIAALNAARAAIRPQPVTEGGDPTYHRGRVVPHTSEPGSSLPDVGISVGLGDGACLFAGEVLDVNSQGWALALYTDTDRLIIAKDIDSEAGIELIERMGGLIRQTPEIWRSAIHEVKNRCIKLFAGMEHNRAVRRGYVFALMDIDEHLDALVARPCPWDARSNVQDRKLSHFNVTRLAHFMLSTHDDFMSGREVDEAAANRLHVAAIFGAAAKDACPMEDAAPAAMLRAFLLAIINPEDPDLDYVRAGNRGKVGL